MPLAFTRKKSFIFDISKCYNRFTAFREICIMKLLKIQVLPVVLIGLAAANISAQKVVTNADLDKYREARVRSDEEYLKTYEKRGLPSPEELERRTDESIRRQADLSLQIQARDQQAAYSYQAQANAIASQIAGIDEQISYLSSISLGTPYVAGAIGAVGSYGFGYSSNYRGGGYPTPQNGPRAQRASNGAVIGSNTQIVQQQASMFPNTASIRAQGAGNYPGNAPRSGFGRGGNGGHGGYYAPVIIGGNYSQSAAASRLTYLYQSRAELVAQWQTLIDQARK
jgi:hypothetical protein